MNVVVGDPEALARTILVGVLAYLSLVAILRVSGKRTLSQFNAFDFVVTVALGSTLATILLSRDVALAQGVLAFLVLVGMQFVITWSSMRSQRVARLAKSDPTALVYRGQRLSAAMADERVREDELQAAVRAHGAARIEDVDLVVLETDGSFTVVRDLSADAAVSSSVRQLLPRDPASSP